MGLRERINDNPRIIASVTGGLVLIALLMMIWPRGTASGGKPAGITKEFYSVDDGKTWFAEDAGKLPPFDHNGQPAHRARVYRCPHGKEFVAQLERYNDADRKRLESLIDEEKTRSMEFIQLESAFEIKKPGGKEWVKVTAANAARINPLRVPKCPEGATAGLLRVMPN